MTSTSLEGADQDDDPVIAEYDVFVTPQPSDQMYLVQYPNRGRSEPYNEAHSSKPYEVRVKPQSGIVELDVPIHFRPEFDKRKAAKWAKNIERAKEEGQSTFGVASGFDRMPVPRGVRQNQKLEDDEDMEESIGRAIHSGRILHKQTLGGQILKPGSGRPMYMLGAFRGKELHLTQLHGSIQMRPQFHHLDATSYLEQSSRRREAADPARVNEPRAVHMNIKSGDNENVDTNTTKPYLMFAKEEPWTALRYCDEETIEAYEMYHRRLFVEDTGSSTKLASSMNNEQYLDAMSAPRHDPSGHTKTKPLTKKQMRAIDLSDDSEEEQKEGEQQAENDNAEANDNIIPD